MFESFFTPFITIIIAEMLDKSQLALIFLSTKTRRVIPLLVGSILAFAVVDGIAVLFGSVVSSLVPETIVRIVAACIFIFFGLLSFRKDKMENEKKLKTNNLFFSAFILVFLSEWADKTQLATAAFATQFDPLYVFLGVMCAMTVLATLAVFAGRLLATKVNKNLIQKIAGVAFIVIGIILLFS